MKTERHTDRRMAYADGNRNCSDASTSQVLPATPWKLEVAREYSSLEASKKSWPCWHLDLSLLSSRELWENKFLLSHLIWDFPGGSVGKKSVCGAGEAEDSGSIPGSGRSPREGHGNPLQRSCLENPMHRGTWWVTVHRVAKSQTQLSMHALHLC